MSVHPFQIAACTALALLSLDSQSQTMTKKNYDQKCLDAAGVAFILCSAEAKTEVAKEACKKTKETEEKRLFVKTCG